MPAMETQRRQTREPGDDSRRPVWERRMGRITCSVWSQQNDQGKTWYSVSISRIYREDNSWKRSNSYGLNDLPLITRLSEMAMDWIYFQTPRTS